MAEVYSSSATRDDALIRRALAALTRRLRVPGPEMSHPSAVHDYLKLRLAEIEREVFMVLFVDAAHRVVAAEEIFSGTISLVNIYPREVVKRALFHNAAGVILAHNHPSGVAEPSEMDKRLTFTLFEALQTVGVTVLDHIIIAGAQAFSFVGQDLPLSHEESRDAQTAAETDRQLEDRRARQSAAMKASWARRRAARGALNT